MYSVCAWHDFTVYTGSSMLASITMASHLHYTRMAFHKSRFYIEIILSILVLCGGLGPRGSRVSKRRLQTPPDSSWLIQLRLVPYANNALSMYGNTCRLYALQSIWDYANNIRVIRLFRRGDQQNHLHYNMPGGGFVRASDLPTPRRRITTIAGTFTYQYTASLGWD